MKINFQSTQFNHNRLCIKICVTLPINGLAQLEEDFFFACAKTQVRQMKDRSLNAFEVEKHLF